MTTRVQPESKFPNSWDPCLACKNGQNKQDSLHPTSTCQKWLAMSDKQKKETVSCIKHPFRNRDGHRTARVLLVLTSRNVDIVTVRIIMVSSVLRSRRANQTQSVPKKYPELW